MCVHFCRRLPSLVEDMLDAPARECITRCIARNKADMNFSLLALVQDSSDPSQTL